MPDSMIERMARAYYERTHGAFIRDCGAPDDPPAFVPDSWDAADIKDRDHHLANARAVLTAMREPTEAMLRAAADCESSLVADVFSAMIDAALAEEG